MDQHPEVSSPTSEAQAWHSAGAPRTCQPHASEEKGEKKKEWKKKVKWNKVIKKYIKNKKKFKSNKRKKERRELPNQKTDPPMITSAENYAKKKKEKKPQNG